MSTVLHIVERGVRALCSLIHRFIGRTPRTPPAQLRPRPVPAMHGLFMTRAPGMIPSGMTADLAIAPGQPGPLAQHHAHSRAAWKTIRQPEGDLAPPTRQCLALGTEITTRNPGGDLFE